MTARRNYIELESLRGLAALLVVTNHLPAWNPQLHAFTLFRQAGLMVDLFFVLSGFVIHMTYAQRIDSPRALAKFQLLRFGRLYPVHALFLLVFVGIELLRRHGGQASPNAGITHEGTLQAFVQHVFLLQGVLPLGDILTFNAPAWSISVEFYVYLLFGLLVLACRQAGWKTYAAIHVAMAVLMAAGAVDNVLWLARGISGFALGCVLSSLRPRLALRLRLPPWAPDALAVALLAAVLAQWPTPYNHLVVSWLALLLIGSIVVLAGNGTSPLTQVLRHRWLLALGALSYTIYLSHAAVLWFTNQLARFVLKWPEAIVAGSSKPQAALPQALALALFSLLLVVLLSMAVTRWVETPGRNAVRRLADRLQRPRAPAAYQAPQSIN